MGRAVREVMTPNPITVTKDTSVQEVARLMRDNDIGDVLVIDGRKVCGIVTDRDVVIRAIAEDCDPSDTPVGQIASADLTTVTPDMADDEAVQLMREHAIRRVPVVEGNKPVGIVSIGDLALEKDPNSALADISAAPANS